ncbi:PASTA domain-containing protein [Trinickia violacea]|uniref:PASTA domain-containing protein n=1 Tax=Trinickia violacea TaxID=2571746 RepID=A0A4P8IPE0_9BURK|nr:PASTA domain-containing protein [Trinickia violacea]QCP49827.1 PASTA domain-containing protein [Trinickia violacea]
MRRAVCLFMSCVMSVMGCDAHAATLCSGGKPGTGCAASAPSSPSPPSQPSPPPQTSSPPVATQSGTAGGGHSTGPSYNSNPSSGGVHSTGPSYNSNPSSGGGSGAGTAAAIAAGAVLLGGLAAAIISRSNPASTPSADGASQSGATGPVTSPVGEGSAPPPLEVASVPIAASAPERLSIVPNLLGLTVSAALKALEQNGLVIGVDDKDPGASGRHVATQSIMPGEHVPPGTAVTVTLGAAPAPKPKPPVAHHTQGPTQPGRNVPPTAQPELPALPVASGPASREVSPGRAGSSEVASQPPDKPPVGVEPDQPADWPDVTLVAALLALAGAAAYAVRKWWLRPHLVCRISMRADVGQQSCRMSSRHAHLPSVDVRLASQPWEAHVVDASRPSHRERDHVRRPRHA